MKLIITATILAALLCIPHMSEATRVYVKADATGANDGSSWDDAFTDLQVGLGTATVGDSIWVASGTYVPTSGTSRSISFELEAGVALFGGFAGWETSLNERDIEGNSTILSGEIGVPGKADNSYHVVVGTGTDSTAVLDGFTVTAGKGGGVYPDFVGGGMIVNPGSPTVQNVIFEANEAISGGGMFVGEGAAPTLIDVEFIDNATADGVTRGGGLDNYYGNPTLRNVFFTGNSARLGGAMNNVGGTARMTNCVFWDNLATDDGGTAGWGGGIYTSGGDVTMTNATFVNNRADASGGGIYNAGYGGPSYVTVTNSILSGNIADSQPSEIENVQQAVTTVNHSLIRGSGGSGANWKRSVGTDAGYNIDADPLFVDTTSGDLNLLFGSPAMESGDNTLPDLPPTDHDGKPRILGLVVDMGAYETEITCPPANVFYVDQDGTGVGDGSSWIDAFPDVTQSLRMVAVCPVVDEVWVAAGTYDPTVSGYRDETFALQNDLAIYGGFVGTETTREQRDVSANPTILTGEVGDPHSNDNIYHVVTADGVDSTAVLDGFTIAGGNAAGSPVPNGGGLMSLSASPTIRKLVFSTNNGEQGGAVYIEGGEPVFIDVCLTNNTATVGAGLAAVGAADARFENLRVIDNSALNNGGGMYVQLGSLTITNALFAGNLTINYGGGIYNILGGSVTITNGTFVGNWALNGGAISNSASSPLIVNTILWGNGGDEIHNASGSAPVISYSLVEGAEGSGAGWDPAVGVDGGGNIDEDPLFVDVPGGNFRLSSGSPAIDAGDDGAPNLPVTDLDGMPRILGDAVDMGAYEFDPATGIGDRRTPTLPAHMMIRSVYPNPFNPDVTIAFELSHTRRVRIDIFDVTGRRVRRLADDVFEGGPHTITWDGTGLDGRNVASGVYLLRLESEGSIDQRKIVVLR